MIQAIINVCIVAAFLSLALYLHQLWRLETLLAAHPPLDAYPLPAARNFSGRYVRLWRFLSTNGHLRLGDPAVNRHVIRARVAFVTVVGLAITCLLLWRVAA